MTAVLALAALAALQVTPAPAPGGGVDLTPYFATGELKGAVARYRAGEWAAAAAGLSAATRAGRNEPSATPEMGSERLAGRFLLGLAQAQLGRWREAAATFEALYRDYPLLAAHHAYQAARCHLRLGDGKAALAWAARVPTGSVPDAEARLIRLEVLTRQRRWMEADLEAAQYLAAFPNGPRRAEAMLVRGRALEGLGRLAESAAVFRRSWAEAPSAGASARAGEALARVAAALPAAEKKAAERSAGDWNARGLVLFEQNDNPPAEAAFTAALGAPGLDDRGACTAHFHRAQTVWKLRQRARALPLFAQAVAACEKAGDVDLTVKATYQRARCLAYTGDRAAATQAYAWIEARHPTHSYADDARLRAAEVARDEGDDGAAQALLREVPARYPAGDMVGEAAWRLALRAYQAGALADARRWLHENLRLVPRAEVWYAEGRAEYWLGRTAETPAEARRWYEQAVRSYPLSVYALLSLARLAETDVAARDALVRSLRPAAVVAAAAPAGPATPSAVPGPESPDRPGFLRAIELARMGLGAEAHRELAKLRRDQDGEWTAALLLDGAGLWNVSHAIPRHRLTDYKRGYPADATAAARWRVSYPRAYARLVDQNAAAAAAPMALLMAIMREESAFDERAVSTANCLGLIMLKPETADRFAGRRLRREELFDPATNIATGARYLAWVLKRYRGQVPLAIAAYNAGEGAVDRWLGERGQQPLDEFLETIPYDETRNYTKRVLASYFAYAWLYADDAPVPAVTFVLPRR